MKSNKQKIHSLLKGLETIPLGRQEKGYLTNLCLDMTRIKMYIFALREKPYKTVFVLRKKGLNKTFTLTISPVVTVKYVLNALNPRKIRGE